VLFDVSQYDRVLVIKKSGIYSVVNVPDKLFVDKGMLWCGFIDKDAVFTVVYKHPTNNNPYIKRCKSNSSSCKKLTGSCPKAAPCNCLQPRPTARFSPIQAKPHLRVLEEKFPLGDFLIKGVKAQACGLPTKRPKRQVDKNPGRARNRRRSGCRFSF